MINEKTSKTSEAKLGMEKQLEEYFKSDLENTGASSERIENVVKKAKQEAGMRDLLTHMLLRIWMPIISIGSIFFVFLNRQNKTKK
jgi:hypothetical protein